MLTVKDTYIVRDEWGKLVRLYRIDIEDGHTYMKPARFFIENFIHHGSTYNGLREITVEYASELADKKL